MTSQPIVRLLSLTCLLTLPAAACTDDSAEPGGGTGGSSAQGGSGGGTGGVAGNAGTGGSSGGSGGGAGSATGGSSGAGGSGGTRPDAGSTSGRRDAGAAPDAGPADGRRDGGPAGDGGVAVAVGERLSLIPTIAARWTGARRSTSVEDGVMVFTGVFQANTFGGGNGHNLRIPLPPARDSQLEYRIRFDGNYDFSRGGKIPGLAGGSAPTGCVDTNGSGFSARMMWRENGRLIGYVYDNNQSSDCGAAINTGFSFKTNQWYRVKERVKLNTGRTGNGILQVWVDDQMVINRSNLAYMNESPTARVDWLLFHTFYGGSSQDWAPSRQTSVSYSEIYVTPLAL